MPRRSMIGLKKLLVVKKKGLYSFVQPKQFSSQQKLLLKSFVDQQNSSLEVENSIENSEGDLKIEFLSKIKKSNELVRKNYLNKLK